MTAAAAFFDVDDTLIAVKSIFRFLAFQLAARGRPPGEYRAARQHFRELAAAGVSRTEALGGYFRLFAGEEVADVARHGRRWFEGELAGGALFHEPVLRRFCAHRAAGDLTVLVSGSFPACLDPLADHLGADAVLCSRPEARDGRYTGAIETPMIGTAKARAVRALAADRGIGLDRCTAYGDHPSDLPVLCLVGHPVVVGDDPRLAAHADRDGWTRLAVGR